MRKPEAQKFAADLAEARRAGQKAADTIDDGGTCNMDTLTLYAPGARLTTLKAVGVSCYRLGKSIAISGSFGMGDKNTRGVEAMREYLNARGWKTSIWYQMD